MYRFSKLLILLAVLALVAAACSSDSDDTTTTAAAGDTTTTEAMSDTTTTEAMSDEPIVMATSLPLTGEFSGVGAKHRDGYQFCVDEINRLGGILNRPVELIVEDNRSETEVTVAQYERFINVDNADILFGTFSSLLGYPASSIAELNQMVLPLPSSGAMRVWARGYEYIFYFQQLPAELTGSSIVSMVDYYTETGLIAEPMETAAVVAADDFFAGAIANGFVGGEVSFPDSDETFSLAPGYIDEMGMEVVYEDVWPIGFTDWLTLANSIADAEPDFIAMTTASVDESISLLNALKTVGYNGAEMIYSSQGAQSEFAEELGGTEDGVIIHAVWAEEANWEGLLGGQPYTNADFINNFTAEFGHGPDEDEAIPFAVCQGMEQAIIGTGGTDNVAIKDWMHSRQGDPVKTIMGDFVWGENGLPEERAFLVNQWQEGNLSLVYPVGEFEGTVELVYPKPPFE
ncbi:MAG: amino acid ABC transporter substrate-binding protein [Acidimicrobiia bacterium]